MASLRGSGAAERPGSGPGHWLTPAGGTGRDGGMRVLAIGHRTCLAGVEAPRGSVPQARLDALLGSLEPAP